MMLVMAFPLLGVALFFALPWRGAIAIYGPGTVLSIFYHYAMMSSMKRPIVTGGPGMVGGAARVVSWSRGRGTVRYQGELWRARDSAGVPLVPDASVRIVDVHGLDLIVEPSSGR